ncbi:MAG: hypothetical protein ACOCYZ_06380 [Halococcoides sp.]
MIQKHTLVEALGDNLGEQKAERLIKSAADEAGYDGQSTFDRDDALSILDRIAEDDDAGSMERISAKTLQTQVRADSLGS